MKTHATLMFLAATFLVALAEEKSFNNINIEEYKDTVRLQAFIDCLKGKGACVGEESNVRDRGQQIVETKCEQCSEKEKKLARDLTALISQHYPDELATLFGVYDPTAKHAQTYLNKLNTFSSEAHIPAIPIEAIKKL